MFNPLTNIFHCHLKGSYDIKMASWWLQILLWLSNIILIDTIKWFSRLSNGFQDSRSVSASFKIYSQILSWLSNGFSSSTLLNIKWFQDYKINKFQYFLLINEQLRATNILLLMFILLVVLFPSWTSFQWLYQIFFHDFKLPL